MNPVLDQGVIRNGMPFTITQPTQIQLCPWFVDWIKDKKYKLHNDARRSNIGRAIIKLSESTRWGFAQIGMYATHNYWDDGAEVSDQMHSLFLTRFYCTK